MGVDAYAAFDCPLVREEVEQVLGKKRGHRG